MADFRMPSLGADMEAGTLVKWLKHAGDTVKRGDIIAEVDTDKGAIEIEVFEDGVIEEIIARPGEKVPVGRTLARIRTAGVPATAAAAPRETPPMPGGTATVPAGAPAPPTRRRAGAPVPAPPQEARVAASPAARRRATELGLDLRSIAGTGPDGAITLADVEGTTAVAAAPDRQHALRRAIASAMAKSKREIPHAYVTTTIDMSRAMAWLRDENERRAVEDRLLPAVLLLKAVAIAVPDVPEVNGYWLEDRLQSSPAVHIGTAIALRGGGVISPAIHDVGQRDLGTLMRGLSDLVARVRSGTLRGSELTDATLTVTNLGDQGVDGVIPIIYPPQVAIVGFGRIVERPWVVDGRVEPRPVLKASLSFDHRAVDGHRAGLFLASVDRRLQVPEAL